MLNNCAVRDSASDILWTLISNPLIFAYDLELVAFAPHKLHLHVRISLRLLAFIASDKDQTLHLHHIATAN